MNEAIRQMLATYEIRAVEDSLRALREVMQEIALLGLWRSKFFENAAFYGGTALRVLYGLDRFSEDLDFSLLEKRKNFDLAGDFFDRKLDDAVVLFMAQSRGFTGCAAREKAVDPSVNTEADQFLKSRFIHSAIFERCHHGRKCS